jgi:hypothetical protein
MKHLPSALLLVATGLLSACPPPPPANQEIKPIETQWEKVVDGLPFPLSGEGEVTTLQIGRREFNENFANRGHIEVLYDHQEETITVEMKKYLYADELDAFGDEAAGTPGVFSRMSLWAYVSSGNPGKPSDQAASADCTKDTWKDGCAIYVYYDGQSQPQRSGADFRVHLPTGYRGNLFLVTEDNADDTTYPRRGNLNVDGFCSSGEFDLEAGRANVKFCSGLTPAPTCPPEGIADCEGFPDGSGSEAWSKECDCGGGDVFGSLRIEAPQPWAANITVDIPPSVWLNATVSNTETMKPHQCKPTIDCPAETCVVDATADEYSPHSEFNYPSPSAPAGAGYNLTVISGGCTEIPYVDTPDQWSENTEELPQELRGVLKVCSGCL